MLERYGVDDVAAVFRALVANRAVYVPSFSSDEMVERLQRAWDVERTFGGAQAPSAGQAC